MEGIHAYVRLNVFKLSPTDAAKKVELRYGVFDTNDLLRDEIVKRIPPDTAIHEQMATQKCV